MAAWYDLDSERASILGPTLRFQGELSAAEDLVASREQESARVGDDAKAD